MAQIKISMFNQEQHWDDMRRVILLDNQSSENVFSNPDLVHSIRKSKKTLNLATNAGVLKTNQVATVPLYGDVWFNKDAITNMIADFFTKPIQGGDFKKFRNLVQNDK